MPNTNLSGAKTLRASLIPTASYVASLSINTLLAEDVAIWIGYTNGNETSLEVKVEFSPDWPDTADGSSTWVQETDTSDALVEHAYTATGVYRIALSNVVAGKVRVSVKGTTGSNFVGSLAVATAQVRRRAR
jgi:hypothetical protein